MKMQHLRRRMAAVAVLALAATTMIGVTSASAAPLTNTTWTVSNNQAGATAVTYTFELTTATAGIIGSVTATVPSGTAGTVGAGTYYGLGAGTATFSGTTLTYTVTNPANVAAGVALYIEFTGLTNTTTAGSYTSTVTTKDDNATTPVAIDTADSPSVSIAGTSTVVTVQIPKSLTFTNDTPSFTLLMDPSLTALSDLTKAVTVTVKTNAGTRYTLAAKNLGLKSGSNTITFASTGVATSVADASFAANTFGVSAALTVTGGSLAAVQGAGLSVANTFVGYTTAGETLVTATKPTGNTADSLVLTNRVKIDYNTAAGTYTDSITYTATPTY